MSTTESELEVTDADIEAIGNMVGYHPAAWDCANERDLIRAIVKHFRAKPAASAEPVAWMQEDGSLHTTHESAYFRGGKVTPLCACQLAPQIHSMQPGTYLIGGRTVIIRDGEGQPPAPQWLPIESAKRIHQEYILGYGPDIGITGVHWRDDKIDWCYTWDQDECNGMITHVMPLPAAPGAEG